MVRKCGAPPAGGEVFLKRRDRCMTPKRCCSSTIASPSFLKTTFFSMRECVPINIGISPFATHFKSWLLEMWVESAGFTLEGNLLEMEEVKRPIFIPEFLKSLVKVSKCCLANISVGAI